MSLDLEQVESGRSLWQDAFDRLKANRLAMIGGVILLILAVAVIFVPWFSSYSYYESDLSIGATAPSAEHWLGTDTLGRDLLVRIMFGGRISLMVGLIATVVSLIIGVIYGSISGFVGGKIDQAMMRFVDAMYALPFPLFVIMLMVVFGRQLWLIFVAIGAVEWLTMARIVRGNVLSLRKKEFVDAAICLGQKPRVILFKHVIPNALGPIIVYATLTVPQVMLLEAFISFLGLGVQAPMSSWGVLIADGVKGMETYPWLLIFPGLIFSITLFCLNFLGDGLRDALDPKRSK